MRLTFAINVLLPLAVIAGICRSSKIIMFPFPYYSHIQELTEIGDQLMKQGTHEIHIVLPPSLPQIDKFRKDKRFKLIEYKIKYKDFHITDAESPYSMENFLEELMNITPIEDFRTNVKGYTEVCLNPLEDEEFYEKIKKEKYDLGIIDGFPMSRCYYILMYRLGIPFVSVTTQYEPWLMRNPALPSFVPFPFHIPSLTSRMTFWERLSYLYTLIDWTAFPGIVYLDDEMVRKYAPDMKPVTLDWLAGRSLLWLFDTDIALDYPRPTMPNEVNIGGLSTKPAKALPKDIKNFIDNAPNGVILASFGSMSVLNRKVIQTLLTAFRYVKERVIFRYVYEFPEEIPSHIKLLKWIPQNDILGHPNTKLFITHCGANSQFEALYHGVPMLNMPLFGDQPYNAKRADYKGYSKTLSLLTVTPDIIIENINSIISNSSYKENILKGSQIFKHPTKMTPRQRAAYWIEHVLQYGGKHLHSHALDMKWYEYLMLDILALCVFIVSLAMVLLFMCIKVMSSVIFKKRADKIKKS